MVDIPQYTPPAFVPVPTPKGGEPNTTLYEAASPESKSKWGEWAQGLGKAGRVLTEIDGAPTKSGGASLIAGSAPDGADRLSPVVAKYLEMAQPKSPLETWFQF